ncbi:MAG: zinc ribbon domain-containing protein [Deltaproteobacteria bacterium]|jgi:hypothetical protein|nr:zinc ribbon domain-containing protein [Deltaproteobacteria bacterium]MDZ4346233.1 zinc ribbon domain-containing protein [Candidatus Binatia bacterium]
MRTIADIFGIAILVFGILALVASCVGPMHAANPILFWWGIAMVALGWFISHNAVRKTCPQCAERVKYEAKKCRHCGFDFSPTPQSAV